jgi:gliding motility-associated-like protein
MTSQKKYDFKMEYLNKCEEWKETRVHNTILVEGQSLEENGMIDLKWSTYRFGTASNSSYHLSSSSDSTQFDFTQFVDSDSTSIFNGSNSFTYYCRIKATSASNSCLAYSNTIKVEFKHELFVPNVITPNGDGFNDFFAIKNIKLYQPNSITVFNRWGEVLFKANNYMGDWKADGVSEGTYYFSLSLPDSKREIKGWLQIIH